MEYIFTAAQSRGRITNASPVVATTLPNSRRSQMTISRYAMLLFHIVKNLS